MAEKSEDTMDFFEFSWGKFATGLGIMGMIAILFDWETLGIMFKMFLLTVLVPAVGLAAGVFCAWAPTRALFWMLFDNVYANVVNAYNENAQHLNNKAGTESESKDSDERATA